MPNGDYEPCPSIEKQVAELRNRIKGQTQQIETLKKENAVLNEENSALKKAFEVLKKEYLRLLILQSRRNLKSFKRNTRASHRGFNFSINFPSPRNI